MKLGAVLGEASGLFWGGVGLGGVKLIISNDTLSHAHSHPPSHNISKIFDGGLQEIVSHLFCTTTGPLCTLRMDGEDLPNASQLRCKNIENHKCITFSQKSLNDLNGLSFF